MGGPEECMGPPCRTLVVPRRCVTPRKSARVWALERNVFPTSELVSGVEPGVGEVGEHCSDDERGGDGPPQS